jgi:hypothetical protein
MATLDPDIRKNPLFKSSSNLYDDLMNFGTPGHFPWPSHFSRKQP